METQETNPADSVRCTELVGDCERREAAEWAKLCELEQVCSAAENAARRQNMIWTDAYRELKAAKSPTILVSLGGGASMGRRMSVGAWSKASRWAGLYRIGNSLASAYD